MTDEKKVQDLIDAEYKRIALRDQLAATAPITLDQVLTVFGDPEADMLDDHTRAAVYGIWAMMRYEYADAMMTERRRTMFEATEEQKPTTAVRPDAVSLYEALRQLVGYVEDMSGHAEVARMTQPDTWAEQPDHPMMLARAALKSGRGTSVHHAGDADGWIKWYGGKPPVMRDVKVEVRLRNGSIHTIPAGFFSWAHEAKYDSASPGEIVAYRVVRNVWENREENDIG